VIVAVPVIVDVKVMVAVAVGGSVGLGRAVSVAVRVGLGASVGVRVTGTVLACAGLRVAGRAGASVVRGRLLHPTRMKMVETSKFPTIKLFKRIFLLTGPRTSSLD
jgi:hypothetical protein